MEEWRGGLSPHILKLVSCILAYKDAQLKAISTLWMNTAAKKTSSLTFPNVLGTNGIPDQIASTVDHVHCKTKFYYQTVNMMI